MIQQVIYKAGGNMRFRHFMELKAALNGRSPIMRKNERLVVEGFHVFLDIIDRNDAVQGKSLLGTMLYVNRNVRLLTNFKLTQMQLSALSMAVNHVVNVLKSQQMDKEIGGQVL